MALKETTYAVFAVYLGTSAECPAPGPWAPRPALSTPEEDALGRVQERTYLHTSGTRGWMPGRGS